MKWLEPVVAHYICTMISTVLRCKKECNDNLITFCDVSMHIQSLVRYIYKILLFTTE